MGFIACWCVKKKYVISEGETETTKWEATTDGDYHIDGGLGGTEEGGTDYVRRPVVRLNCTKLAKKKFLWTLRYIAV